MVYGFHLKIWILFSLQKFLDCKTMEPNFVLVPFRLFQNIRLIFRWPLKECPCIVHSSQTVDKVQPVSCTECAVYVDYLQETEFTH
jgi:hypothetical protein